MNTELVAQMFKNYQSNVLFHLEGRCFFLRGGRFSTDGTLVRQRRTVLRSPFERGGVEFQYPISGAGSGAGSGSGSGSISVSVSHLRLFCCVCCVLCV